MIKDEIRLSILKASQYEHFKAGKDLSYILELNHPVRVKVQESLNNITDLINKT